MLVFRIELDIRHVDDRTLDNRSPCPEGPRWTRREYAIRRLEGFRGVVVLGHTVEEFTVKLIERAEEAAAQSHGAADDRVEDRLDVGLRPADDVQNFSGGRRLLEGLA